MKDDAFLSKYELLDEANTIERRQKRLIQVRQQSKEMSATILDRVKKEAKKQNEDIENRVLAEIRNYHLKELASRRQQYEKCISEINRQHYLQQINLNNSKLPNSRRSNKSSHSVSKVEQIPHTNFHKQKENTVLQKRNFKETSEIPATRSSFENCVRNANIKNDNSFKLSQNIVVNSDEESESNQVVKFCQNLPSTSPETKGKTVPTRDNLVKQRCKHRKNLICQNNIGTKLSHSITDDDLRNRNGIMKTEIDEMYNHLVHDRIRVLEQKDKILSRQTRFLPNAIDRHSFRFHEYFVQYRDHAFVPIHGSDISEKTSARGEDKLSEIKHNMERVELKKRLLREELSNTENKATSNVVASEECEISDNLNPKHESPSDSTSEEKSESPVANDEPLKKSLKNIICPSPILKASNRDDMNPCEAERKSKMIKHGHRKRKFCSKKGVTVTIVNKEAIIKNRSTSLAKQTHSSELSSMEHDQVENRTESPVNIIVNVLSASNCKIEIKKNGSNKRCIRTESKQNTEKVKNWRTLFKNDEKLTESSYYSPPECHKKLEQFSSIHKTEDEIILLPSQESVKDIDYYIRKLLLMSPESIENLDISSCNTTLDETSSISGDFNSLDTSHSSCEQSKEISSTSGATDSGLENGTSRVHNSTVESENDPHYIKQVLLECLKAATSNQNDLKIPPFTSINSTGDYKIYDSCSNERATISPNLRHSKFLNTAIQRLLPFYHDSLDDYIDCTAQLSTSNFQHFKELLDQTIDDSNADKFSTSACLRKLLSTSSFRSEMQNERETIDHTQYIESFSPQHSSNSTKREQLSENRDSPSKERNNISLPSISELIEKGLISKTYAMAESSKNNEEKQFIDEEEFLKKMLIVDIPPKEKSSREASDSVTQQLTVTTTKYGDGLSQVPQENVPDTSSNDIRKELRLLGLNWMDTTLQRTLQASAINSTSSADDSAGPVRSMQTLLKHQSNDTTRSPLAFRDLSQHPTYITISPITVPDIQLTIPERLRPNDYDD